MLIFLFLQNNSINNMDNKKTFAHKLTVFSLVMITVGSVDSIRNLPATALFGSSLIFFFLFAALFFLIPSALVSAELSAAWPEQGGIYVWVKKAFGQQIGFLTIWFQWIENVVWYPTILSFTAGTLGYLISPNLANDKIFLITVILSTFWGTTLINLLGMKLSSRFSNFCTITGLLLPIALIISLGIDWLIKGNTLQISFSPMALLPNLHEPQAWVALTGIMMSFCGIEIATVHARDVKNPQHAFPKALFISSIILITTLILGSLSIAMVLPTAKISLVSGIMQAFDAFFIAYHLEWVMPIVATLLIIGTIGGVSNWIIAPTKGLLVALQDINLSKHFQRENKHGAPSILLVYQACIVTILVLAFLIMPSVNGAYWLLTALTAQLYMFMYIAMYATGIYMRYKYPDQQRPYRIPGRFGMSIVCYIGIMGAIITIAIGFVPPININVGSTLHYESLLIMGLILLSAPPLIIYQFKK